MSVHEWDQMYRGTPPWDIGRPQSALVEVAEAGGLRGRVLDVGCGTGEHVLMAASYGLPATGVDLSPLAISIATEKAKDRKVGGVKFVVADLLTIRPDDIGGPFDTVTDNGVFHVFSDEDRPRFVANLRALLTDQGHYVMLCFSDAEPGDWGPRRVTEEEIRASFSEGWRIETIEPVRIEVVMDPGYAHAWRCLIASA